MEEKVNFVRKFYRRMLYRDLDKVYAKHFSMRQMRRNGKKALDVGMGFGFELITKFREGYDCYGFDYDKARVGKTGQMFEKNGMKATLKVGDAQKIPFGSNMFDVVVCSHVIEHVPSDTRALAEIRRVLKRKGTLYLRVPHINNLHTQFRMKVRAKNPYTDRTHLREYSEESLREVVKKSGFKILSVRKSGFFTPIGLKLFMILAHYLPWGELMEYMGEKFPNHAAEIKLTAVRV